jgi:Domain of unknown function (DUF4070)
MNFIPSRPVEEIAKEYVHAFCTLYEPERFLDRVYRHFLQMAPSPCKAPAKLPSLVDLKALAIIIWRQGFKRNTRWKFWHHLFSIIRQNPGVWDYYLTVCAHAEHFIEYRQLVREQIEAQLAEFQREEAKQERMKAVVAQAV